MAGGQSWTADNISDLSGKTVVITGANSGIGYEAALAMARKHAKVVLACRSIEKAEAAASQIGAACGDADVEAMRLDLASLASIRSFSDSFHRSHSRLDILCNNAGVMAVPYRRTTDGFELQMGTNHFGHFALTGMLLDLLMAAGGARVVTVSSGAHRFGTIRFDDLNWERGYRKWPAYGQSKLANLLFCMELDQRLKNTTSRVISAACHPGWAATNLQFAGPEMDGSRLVGALFSIGNRMFAQNAAMGALPTLYAAVAPDVRGNDFIGPDGIGELRGYPTRVSRSAASCDASTAARLWDVSEQLTGVRYNFS